VSAGAFAQGEIMKIALITHGTRGDIQPFVAVALALMERGHGVTLAAPPNLQSFIQKCGVRAEKVAIDSQAFMESEEGRKWLAAGNVSAFIKRMNAISHAHRDELIDDYLRACGSADLIIANFLTEDFASVIAEQRSIPLLSLHMAPLRVTTDAFPSPLVTTRQLPFRVLNRATHALFDNVWWKGARDDVNVFRQRLGLQPANRSTARRLAEQGAYTIHAFSPRLVPQPFDWGKTMPVVGSIGFPIEARRRLGEATPDPELAAWLRSGKPPVYYGFGSMPVRDPAEMTRIVSAVAHKRGERAIIGAGWSRLEAAKGLADHVRIVGAVDHGWLFPQCSAAVHHGGAGTVFAVTSAGLPSVVCSVIADQPFWGVRLERLGVGVHLPFKKLTAASLENALLQVSEPGVRKAAALLGADLQAESDALPCIVSLVEQLEKSPRSKL
jgi:sterol 3beta-glucosyltransferase